jgi:curved DNA-binding protein CbpA
MAYHPDRNQEPASLKRFQEINAAYETLGNHDKKRSYDNLSVQSRISVEKTPEYENPIRKSERDWSVNDDDYTQYYQKRKVEFKRHRTQSDMTGISYRPAVGQVDVFDDFGAAHLSDRENKIKEMKSRRMRAARRKEEDEEA